MAVSLARGRIAIGVVSLLAPALVGRMMTGRDGSGGGTTLFARMVGAATSDSDSDSSSPWTAAHRCAAGSKHPPW